MNKQHKIDTIQGLIVGLKEHIYRLEQFKKLTKEVECKVYNDYIEAIKKVVNEEKECIDED